MGRTMGGTFWAIGVGTALTVAVWIGLGGSAWAAPPEILSVEFPTRLPSQGEGIGTVVYEDPDRDVVEIRLDVVDGRYRRVVLPAAPMADARARQRFTLPCWPYDQRITLAVRAVDAAGASSAPKLITFTCGRPALHDFDAQQAQAFPVESTIPLNVFILDDGETAVAEGARFEADGPLGRPRPEVLDALRSIVMPTLTGVWDQCGVGFELAGAWVVRPERVKLAGLPGSLADWLYARDRAGRAILHERRQAIDALQRAISALWEAARQRNPQAARALNVVVVGARILARWDGALRPIEGFAQPGRPGFAVVRWGAALPGVTPRQMVATLAHELGHLLGLGHPGEDGLPETSRDPHNLMKGSGTTPQPRAHLLPSQCRVARRTLVQLAAWMEARAADADAGAGAATPGADSPSGSAQARVRWVSLCPGGVCSGIVTLEVEVEGFPDLQSFGFALFEFSRDGERFIEIGVDRTPSDGFRVEWDTRALPEGLYIVRATVTDATGARAHVTARVEVRR